MEISSESQKEIDMSHEIKNLKKVEAALFISARYLNIQELVGYTDINPLLLKELLDKLKQSYKEKESAIEIIENNGMWKMDVREEYHKMVNKFATGNAEFTKAEQETLAIIAYKQPAKQSVIVKIRGNKAYEHIKHFIELGLLKAKRVGHTKELTLSENFYDYFSLIDPKESGENPELGKKVEELEERDNVKEQPSQENSQDTNNEEKVADEPEESDRMEKNLPYKSSSLENKSDEPEESEEEEEEIDEIAEGIKGLDEEDLEKKEEKEENQVELGE
jgi:segregation and condensation protein B